MRGEWPAWFGVRDQRHGDGNAFVNPARKVMLIEESFIMKIFPHFIRCDPTRPLR